MSAPLSHTNTSPDLRSPVTAREVTVLLILALAPSLLPAQRLAHLEGTVSDPTEAAVANARVDLKSTAGAVVASSVTGAEGTFHWAGIPEGEYQLSVAAPGFAPREIAVRVAGQTDPLLVRIEPMPVHTRVTVSATRGGVDPVDSSAYVAIVKDAGEAAIRPLPTIGSLLVEEPGILVQQSTYAQVSPFLRGLTGYHVLNLIDGIRFNNSTFRSGPNQYLAFVEPNQAQRVEALLGPAGAQYGSDSLGGTINVVTLEPRFATQAGLETHGHVGLFGATADLSGGGDALLALGTERLSWLIGAAGRDHNDLRAGGGADSRNVFHRLFGMPFEDIEDLIGSRQQDTGFRQYGLHTKFAARLRSDQMFSLWYQRGVQSGVRGYKDLLGGLGRLQSSFDPQILNFFYARYEKLSLGWLDSLSGTFSVNSQADGGARQNLRETDPITYDDNQVDSYGYSGQATRQWRGRLFTAFGGDVYDERVRSDREVQNPVLSSRNPVRPLYPDHSTYRTFGLFGQSRAEVIPGRLHLGAGARLTGVQFRTREEERYNVPESSQWFRDVTFNTSASWQVTSYFGLQALISRGFRAPNLNDLGALGLNDLGYEIPAAEALPAGALLSNDAGEAATSKGERLAKLAPESLMNYEFGFRFQTRRLYARAQGFNAELYDPIVRRTLLFSADNVPDRLAGIPVTVLPQSGAQRDQRVVTVATPFDPRSVKAFVNDGRARYYGIEALANYTVSSRWSLSANYSFLAGRELNPNRNMRRLPPQSGAATVRYTPSGRRIWFEVSLAAAGPQERLSGGDLDDERIGASRRRQDIADFFHGARVRPFLDPVTGVFRPTGETLLQIQDRVLPAGVVVNGVRVVNDATRVPLYLSTAGWATANVRAGVPLGERWRLLLALENLADKQYRFHGSGVDAPGIGAYANLRFSF